MRMTFKQKALYSAVIDLSDPKEIIRIVNEWSQVYYGTLDKPKPCAILNK